MYRCDLTPNDWNLPDTDVEIAKRLNYEFVNAINGGTTLEAAELRMGKVIIELGVADKTAVGSALNRLLRATFE